MGVSVNMNIMATLAEHFASAHQPYSIQSQLTSCPATDWQQQNRTDQRFGQGAQSVK